MDDLLSALKTAIAAASSLSYLRGTEILEDKTLPPEELGFPFVGLLDGGTAPRSMPGQKKVEELTVEVVPYQSILLDSPGAAVVGSEAQLGTQGKGVIKIAKDLETLLVDNFLNQEKIHFAFLSRQDKSQALVNEEKGLLIVMKPLTFTYRRYV